jgi:hypothetical protein
MTDEEKKYNLEYLKSNGYFNEIINDSIRTEEGETIDFKFDPSSRIAYFEDVSTDSIKDVSKELKRSKNFDYYWFWNNDPGRVAVIRTYGENKQFIFNQSLNRGVEYRKSKESKLEDIESGLSGLFDVKDVVNKFYKNLWDIRLNLARSINTKDEKQLSDQEKIIAAQRTIDRIIFTYFLVEKGFIHGIDDTDQPLDLDPKTFFTEIHDTVEDFSGFLNDLFFEYLNKSDKEEYPFDQKFSVYIPYLNGGLFRHSDIETQEGEVITEEDLEIDFDWTELISELNNYNWIIDDYSDSEDEGSQVNNLTPEILGHIYEKFVITVSELSEDEELTLDKLSKLYVSEEGELLEGNKSVGAYYTPDYIATENSREALWNRLSDKIGEEMELENSPSSFDELYEMVEDDDVEAERVTDLIKEMTVIDPGVGSGAFLLSTGEIIENWLLLFSDESRYEIRKHIVTSQLYGVDLLEGATEICKLRLWLWLVTARKTEYQENRADVDPLPNIDFNIRQGNSLIGIAEPNYDQSMIPHLTFEWRDGEDKTYPQAVQDYQELIEEYKYASGDRAKELRSEIKDAENLLQQEFNDVYRKRSEVEVEEAIETVEEFRETSEELSRPYNITVKFEEEMSDEDREKLQNAGVKIRSNSKYKGTYEDARKISEDDLETVFETLEGKGDIYIERKLIKRDIEDLDPFHWMFEFPSTFAPNKDRRFDVVIGNPPHGSDLGDIEKPILEDFYDLIERRREVAKMFLERSWKLTGGELSFIIPKASTYNSTWRDFRKFGTDKLRRSVDLGKAFPNVDHEQITTHLSKGSRESQDYTCGFLKVNNYKLESDETSQVNKEFAKELGTIPSNLSSQEMELASMLNNSGFPRLEDYDTLIGRGAPRRHKTQSEDQPLAFQGKEVQRYRVLGAKDNLKESKISNSCRERMDKPKVIAQRLVAHIQNPYDHIKMTALYEPRGDFNFETVSNIVLEDEDLPDEKVFTLLLHSPLLNWFTYILIYNRAIRNMDFDEYFVERLIVPSNISEDENEVLSQIHDLVAILSEKGEENELYSRMQNISNALTYQLYLKDIQEESLETSIFEKFSSILEDLNELDYESFYEQNKDGSVSDDFIENAEENAEMISKELDLEEEMEEIAKNKWVQIIERTSDSEEVTIDFGAR